MYKNYERIFSDSFLWSMKEYIGIPGSLKKIFHSAKLERQGEILIIISIEGDLEGEIVLDIPKQTTNALVGKLAQNYQMSQEETKELLGSILKEWLNLIMGHAISILESPEKSHLSEGSDHLNIREARLYVPREKTIFYIPTRSIEIESEIGNSFLHFVHKKESFVHKNPSLVLIGLEEDLERSFAHIILYKGFECIRTFQYIRIEEASSMMDQLKGKNADFCLLDWEFNPSDMPCIIEKLQEIYPLMRVIVLSDRRDSKLFEQLKSLGVAGFIPKDLLYTPILMRRLESILRRMGLCMVQDKRNARTIPVPEKNFFQIHFPLPPSEEKRTAEKKKFVIGKVVELGIEELKFTASRDGNGYSSLKKILVESPDKTFKEIVLESEEDMLLLEGNLLFMPEEDLYNLKYANLKKRSSEKLLEWLTEFQKLE